MRSVDTDNLSYSLNDRKVLKVSSKHHQSAMFYNSFFVELLIWVSYLHSADKSIRLEGLVWEASI